MAFNVQILLRLVDQLTGPARQIASSYRSMQQSITASSHTLSAATAKSTANLNQLSFAANTANASVSRLATNMRNMRTLAAGFSGLGLGGGAMIAGFPLVHMLKIAADYEDKLLDIRKVWQGTESDYELMVGKLRRLNSQIPLSRSDIATLLEEGIKSGVSRDIDELEKFTIAAAKFAKAFELPSIEEAADKLAKLKGSLNLSMPEFTAMADSMNTIAGNFATTEADLIDIVRRVGGTAKAIGGARGLGDLLIIGGAQTAAGVRREVAATGLRSLLARLSTQPKDTRDGLAALGLDPKEVSKRLPTDMFGTILDIMTRISEAAPHDQAGLLAKIAGMRTFDAFAPLLSNLDLLRKLKEIYDSPERLTMEEEYQRRITGINSALRVTLNVLGDLSDSIVMAWKPQILTFLEKLRELAESMKASPILQWTAALFAGLAALSLVALPIAILGASLFSIGLGFKVIAGIVGPLTMALAPLVRLFMVFAAGEIMGLVGALAKGGRSMARLTTLAYRFGGALGALTMAVRVLRRAFMLGLVVEAIRQIYNNWSDLKAIANDPIHLKVIWPEMPEWLQKVVDIWSKIHNGAKFGGMFLAEKLRQELGIGQEQQKERSWWDWLWGSSEEEEGGLKDALMPGRNPNRMRLPERSPFRIPLPERSPGVPEAIAKGAAAAGKMPAGLTIEAIGPQVIVRQAPPSVNVSVTVNATTNASPEAIGAAAASAVGNKVRGALSDAPLGVP